MLLKTLGANAQFARQFQASDKITRIANPNSARLSGLILNKSSSIVLIELGDYPDALISQSLVAIELPMSGGNMDIPANYVGAIWAKWVTPSAAGFLNIYHYYNSQSC